MWSNKYSEKVKEKVVATYLQGRGDVQQVSKEYGIPASTIKGWVSSYWEKEECELQKELEKKREDRATAARNRKRRFVNGRELKVVRPTSSSAYIDWRIK